MAIRQGVALVALAGWLSAPLASTQEARSGAGTAASSNPDAAGVYHRAAGMTMPKVVTHTNPVYTESARKEKVQGDCVVALVVDAEGVPQNVRVVRSIAETNPDKSPEAAKSLDEKAIEAVRQYRFAPAMYQGRPVPVELRISVNFQIF